MNQPAKATRAQFLAHCEAAGIEVDDDEKQGKACPFTGVKPPRAIGVYAPKGFKFALTETHFQGLGEFGPGVRIPWGELIADCELVACDEGDECDYCHEGDA